MTEKMEEKLEEQLIKAVRKHDCLYNSKSRNYRNTKYKDITWRSIASNLNITSENAQKKWKNLRDYYFFIKRSEQKSPSSAASKKRKWKCYYQLQFLDDIPKIRNKWEKADDEEYFNEFIIEEESSQSDKKSKKIKPTNNTTDDLKKFLETATLSIQETCVWMRSQEEDSISTYFRSLAEEVKEANLPHEKLLRLKRKIFNVIYEELENNEMEHD
ncbi:uncharacterized protein LOC119682692 [Teleopsis dalmanni]|uniref:uncharacterized protein LOC119682692 n=1 Tax=Teleopsis dalmanni TaxID=139649 RepID=UPI0018CEF1D5|nr:uncharacterized protein LOC119682692 [Teleopsis dalmanni]